MHHIKLGSKAIFILFPGGRCIVYTIDTCPIHRLVPFKLLINTVLLRLRTSRASACDINGDDYGEITLMYALCRHGRGTTRLFPSLLGLHRQCSLSITVLNLRNQTRGHGKTSRSNIYSTVRPRPLYQASNTPAVTLSIHN